ncbi:arylesterase [Candidatus Venteria ishoeyi]|uniref:arylesterase n=1 Tax=Candidatus Venteria ishoeyi TaxID=1899563 RepID=UPI00255D14DC|nr:arylesterase [Candidatus Venteria ishoeyi]MDM8545339.1 arylesterase [Candidatus Venteria ishoeyi]
MLIGCTASPPPLKILAEDDVILAFGDSLTYGTGAQPEASYPSLLENQIQRRVINAGVPGERSGQGLARLPGLLKKHQPKLLLLCHGGNDFLQHNSDQQVVKNLRAMIQLAQQQGIEVVLIAVPKPGFFLSGADLYHDVASEFKIPIQQDIISQVLSKPHLKSDQIHPNAEGYQQLAAALAVLLSKAGAIKE